MWNEWMKIKTDKVNKEQDLLYKEIKKNQEERKKSRNKDIVMGEWKRKEADYFRAILKEYLIK